MMLLRTFESVTFGGDLTLTKAANAFAVPKNILDSGINGGVINCQCQSVCL